MIQKVENIGRLNRNGENKTIARLLRSHKSLRNLNCKKP